MTIPNLFVGVDVSKDALDVALWTAGTTLSLKALKACRAKRFANSDEGRQELRGWIQRQGSLALILCESTGGYEQPLLDDMQQAQLPIARVNPRRPRDFAKSLGQFAKTDTIDAAVLASYACVHQPQPTKAPDPDAVLLRALSDRRDNLRQIFDAESNRLARTRNPTVQAGITRHLSFLKDELASIQSQMQDIISQSAQMKETDRRLQTIPGVGPLLSVALLSRLPELGEISNKEVAALVGVAPLNKDSGNTIGRRFCHPARQGIKRVLYMAALSATRHNPVMTAFYKQLCEGGKPKKLALVACMRKLLTWANTLVKKQQDWSTEVGFENRPNAQKED